MSSKSTYLAILIVALIVFSIGYYWTEIREEEPPAQVTGLTVTTMGETRLFLVWNQNTEPDLDHYNIYRSTQSGFTIGSTTKIDDTMDNYYDDTGLTASTTYYYRVTAVDTENNEGPPSEEASGTTSAITPPAQVTGLGVAVISGTQLRIVWNQNTEPDLDHYNIYRSTQSGFTIGSTTKIDDTMDNYYDDTGLTPSTTYYYRVTAVDTENNEGPPSEEASGTTKAVSEFLWTPTTIVLTVITIIATLTIIIRKYKP